MSRSLLFGLLAAAAAVLVFRRSSGSGRRVVPVQQAADLLRQAWAKNHTTA